MGKASKEKVWTTQQLKRNIGFMKFMLAFSAPSLKKQKKRVGRELFLNTGEGTVRVLGYRLEDPRTLPLFVDIHGGGFVLGSADMDDPLMPDVAAKADIKVLSVEYSLAPDFPFPKAVNECYAVALYAKEHPDEFGIDPDRIAMGGHSAGGNYSASVCLSDNAAGKKLGLKCLVLDYPPLDVYTDPGLKPQPKGALPVAACRMFDACYLNDREARKNPLVSPVFATQEQLRPFPPTLLITASRDSLCAEAELFRDKLKEAGVPVTHKRFDAVHGFNLGESPESTESWQMIVEHLKKYL
jgi:acetyl esterase